VGGWRHSSREHEIVSALTAGDAGPAPQLLRRYGCAGCHTIDGVPGGDGKVGPALIGLRSRVFIAGSLRNTSDNLVGFIHDPQALAPDAAMPRTGISLSEARDVAAYLYGR
jgi:cytochrome c2